MSSSETENDSDEERREEVIFNLELYDCAETVEALMQLYTVDAYRWLIQSSAQSMVDAVLDPIFYNSSVFDYMTQNEYNAFQAAIQEHLRPRKRQTSPFMQTLVHFITDVFHACDREPVIKSYDAFLTQLCVNNRRIMRVPKRPRTAPKPPSPIRRAAVTLRPVTYSTEGTAHTSSDGQIEVLA